MKMTQEQIEIEAQNYLNGLDLPENADKQLILDNFKNGMAWAMMLIKEGKQQMMADKENITTNENKAKEIAKRNAVDYDEDYFERNYSEKECYKSALDAMEWKDEQYNEEKRDLLGLVKMLKIDEHNQTIIEDLVAILNS